ncbi:exosome complex exonuclease-like protein Rrp6 [Clohesyomyces aquaticus]|uniref:Exosome complex exonuclease-like protein Rrp6 n=1 Tax=Clohesyomyces aquaticus TaxID=1231657 RepID=A0A1Y1ZSB7_9PLEO|nr:exosome complex exonuclease-like protein Rrp6 [Clohesyomyces aquaticus]
MESFKSLQDSISAALVSTTRSATQIGAADVPFQRSLDPALGTALDEQNARLLRLAQRLLENAAASSDAVGPRLPDVEAIDNNWRAVVDVIDSLLEKADTSLDEYTGVVKRLSPSADQAASASKPRPKGVPKHFPKPQLLFEHAPKNNEVGGFKPLMTSKPHAKIPLDECLKAFKDSNDREQYPHPYQTEIETYEYPSSMYQRAKPIPYTPFESTSATFVDTPEALDQMLAELKAAKEIAVDLEHHDNRSYIGLVSLMQISTREKDWIVDTLKPWRRRLECLNEVFADPNIIKVLHGSYMDIVWLQRDFGLYIVGLFDTFHAARSLGYPGASLAYLLDHFVQFKAQKQYQLADWRVRPLSDELLTYARADTHFLLYIFDNMRNELIEKSDFGNPEKNKVHDVLNNSRETSLQRYEHPIYDMEIGLGPVGWYRLLTRMPAQFTPQQFAVFKAVHGWRDKVAREEDDSPVFIMPNHAIFSIARSIPEDKAALFSVTQHVSHVLRARGDELVRVIAQAKIAGENGPELDEALKKVDDIKNARRAQFQQATAMDVDPIPVLAPAPTPAPISAPILQRSVSPTLFSAEPIRAHDSAFWGGLWDRAVSENLQRHASKMDISLALPLPPLTAEIFATGPAQTTPKVDKPQHTFVPKEKRPAGDPSDDVFIVREVGGRKRTRTEAAAEEAPPTPEPTLGDDTIMLAPDKALANEKKEKKARKKALKKQKALEAAGNADADEEAFDYAAAPTVLNAQNRDEQGRSGKKKKDKKKPQGFNPYAKLQDVPKGMPRSQKEGPGRSKTFQS